MLKWYIVCFRRFTKEQGLLYEWPATIEFKVDDSVSQPKSCAINLSNCSVVFKMCDVLHGFIRLVKVCTGELYFMFPTFLNLEKIKSGLGNITVERLGKISKRIIGGNIRKEYELIIIPFFSFFPSWPCIPGLLIESVTSFLDS